MPTVAKACQRQNLPQKTGVGRQVSLLLSVPLFGYPGVSMYARAAFSRAFVPFRTESAPAPVARCAGEITAAPSTGSGQHYAFPP
jgi:hypothetical protein